MPHRDIRVLGRPLWRSKYNIKPWLIIRLESNKNSPIVGRVAGFAMAQITNKAMMKLRFQSSSIFESLALAPSSETPANRAPKFSPTSPCRILTNICWHNKAISHKVKSYSSIEIGM